MQAGISFHGVCQAQQRFAASARRSQERFSHHFLVDGAEEGLDHANAHHECSLPAGRGTILYLDCMTSSSSQRESAGTLVLYCRYVDRYVGPSQCHLRLKKQSEIERYHRFCRCLCTMRARGRPNTRGMDRDGHRGFERSMRPRVAHGVRMSGAPKAQPVPAACTRSDASSRTRPPCGGA